MSAQIIPFQPAIAAPAAAVAAPEVCAGVRHAGRRYYRFADVVSAAGLFHLKPRAALSALRTMTKGRKLPPPVTPRIHAGQVLTGTDAIGKKALWDAAAVDAALNPDPLPPQAGAMPPPSASLRDRMRSRAASMGRA